MGQLTDRKQTILVANLYRSVWRVLISLVAVLVVVTNTARPHIVLPFFTLAFFLMTNVAESANWRKNRIILGLYPCIAAVLISRLIDFRSVDELPATMIEFIAGFLPILLANHDRPRSFWLAILNSSIIAIGCVIFSSSVLVYLIFIFFILTLMLALNVGNLHLRDSQGVRAATTINLAYFRQFLHVIPAGLMSAAIIFVAFPRVQTFTNAFDFGSTSRTGYSGMISLNDRGPIETSQALAFVATSPDHTWLQINGPRLLFRGDALDTFDGTTWKGTIFGHKHREQSVDRRLATQHAKDIISLTVFMEPQASAAVFYPDILIDTLPQSTSFGDFLFNSNGSVIRESYSTSRFSYLVRFAPAVSPIALPKTQISAWSELLKSNFATKSVPHEITENEATLYTTVPKEIAQSAWFRQWTSELNINVESDSITAVASKLARHFQTSFKASLRHPMSNENSLEIFLTETREGHCEFFATAAALLWRNLGIPARVVVGYRGGDFNPLIDALEVREEHAHAWIEVFLPEFGWYQFDPTPAIPVNLSESFTWILRMSMNAAGFFFRQYIVDYNYQTQQDLLQTLRNASLQQQYRNLTFTSLKAYDWKSLVIILVILGSAIILRRRWRRKDETFHLPKFYRIFLKKVARRGLYRHPAETFASFHRRCLHQGVDANLIDLIDQALEIELYAEIKTSPQLQVTLLKALERFP